MKYTCHHAEKWIYANIDLAEEKLENHSKVLIVIAGASSSGKSFFLLPSRMNSKDVANVA